MNFTSLHQKITHAFMNMVGGAAQINTQPKKSFVAPHDFLEIKTRAVPRDIQPEGRFMAVRLSAQSYMYGVATEQGLASERPEFLHGSLSLDEALSELGKLETQNPAAAAYLEENKVKPDYNHPSKVRDLFTDHPESAYFSDTPEGDTRYEMYRKMYHQKYVPQLFADHGNS